ncbi:MAG: Fe-S cluster assembly protein SufD [Bacteroidales bacterium]|nr:Fe-S cluster assembly protein SufD [Bacteroidales bacterium]
MEPIIQELSDLRQQLRKDEVWRDVDFSDLLNDTMRTPRPEDSGHYTFHCNIPMLDTYSIVVENGFCNADLVETEEGIIMGSLRKAMQTYPDLVAKGLDHTPGDNAYRQFNKAHYSDGAFVYVPARCSARKPLQFISMHTAEASLLVQTRNVVVVEDDSQLTLIHCDDTTNTQRSFANNVTEIVAGRNAHIEHYKMQNLNDQSGLLSQTFTSLQEAASLLSVAITFNGGYICNHAEVIMDGEHCSTEVHGLYLNDKEQRVDNYVFVDHRKPNCHSHELYKGILDDSAHGTFNGHVLVDEGAAKTEAYMSNRNILLTDKATVYTKPFLEIYNDDVKCSHGSTIGQMDDDAMFYLRSRGISQRSARTLLLYAFCDEVVEKIQLTTLRTRLSDMIKQRLHGNLTACSDCVLGCNMPCGCSNSMFDIDTSLL